MPTLDINGLNFNVHTSGEGYPVVILHGYCASISMWSHLVPVLEKHYRVVAYDARGHGLSSAPRGKEHYGLHHLVEDLSAVLDSLGIYEAILIGHSMGGATVQAFAAKYGDRARATLICNIDGGYQPIDEDSARQTAEASARSHTLVRERGLCDYARHQIDAGIAPAFVRDSEHERASYLERYARQPINGYFGVGEALPWREAWLKDTVTTLNGPVAIIAGTDDVMHTGAKLLHQQLPHARMISISDAPHDSVNARPAAFNQAVLEFIEAVETGAEVGGEFTV